MDRDSQGNKLKIYKLLSGTGEIYDSHISGLFGGNKKEKIYGRLDCPSANRYVDKGYYKIRVFFASIDDAISAGYRPCAKCMRKEYLEWKTKSNIKCCTSYSASNKERQLKQTLTRADYKKAFNGVGLSSNQIKLLNGWYKEGINNWATPGLLKEIMGYEETGRVNIDVGTIGKLVVENLKLDPNDYLSDDKTQTAYWSAYCDEYDQEMGWHLYSEFFNALIELRVISV